MSRPFEVGFSYFCANCEEECEGTPGGVRKVSKRPLCVRCAQIGAEEGWGELSICATPTYVATERRGLFLILILMLFSGLALFMLLAMNAGKTER